MNYIKDVKNKDYFAPRVIDFIKNYEGEETLTYSIVMEEFNISDILIYEIVMEHDRLLLAKLWGRRNLPLKLRIIRFVMEHPYEYEMSGLVRMFPESNNSQILCYLNEEGMKDKVPTKYERIELDLMRFLRGNEGIYSTQEVINLLGMNRKTFYKIYNSREDIKRYFRRISQTCQTIKEVVDSYSDKLTVHEIAELTGFTPVVVKNNIATLKYEDKIEIVPSVTEQVLNILEEHKNKYSVTDLAEMIGSSYNTVYKVIQRHNLYTDLA